MGVHGPCVHVRGAGAPPVLAVSLTPSPALPRSVGQSTRGPQSVFTLARKISPCVVFLDEIDSLLLTRGGGGGGGGGEGGDYPSRREIVNELMAEWDGVASRNDGVLVMGATNRPFDLDDAVLRRMPRRVLGKRGATGFHRACAVLTARNHRAPPGRQRAPRTVDLPDAAARREILELMLRDEALSPDVDLGALAVMTANYSGSDLKNLCMAAALNAVRRAIRATVGGAPDWSAVPVHRSLQWADFLRAFDEVGAAHRALNAPPRARLRA